MKKILLVLLVLSALPLRSIAQDDLYFVPKKKVEKKKPEPKKAETPKPAPAANEGQLDMFSMLGGETAA